MLRELHISNLAVIEDVVLELDRGLNCFTGQTGAGKSLVLGAIELLLGLRMGGVELLRPGAAEARISGLFELRDAQISANISAAADLTLPAGEPLLITRRTFTSGRTSVSVNGQPATTAMVRAIGEVLVDVHGQHDHQYLLKPSNQLEVLDSYADASDLRQRFLAAYSALRDLRQRRQELTISAALRRQQLDLYEFQAGEIDAAELQPGELDDLRRRHLLLSNIKRIKSQAGTVHAAIYESEGAVVERVQMAAHLLGELAELDPALTPIAEQVKAAALSLQDSSFDLGRYIDRLDLDPEEMSQVEERLNTLNRLVAKYADSGHLAVGTDVIEIVLAYRQKIELEIGRLRNENQDMDSLDGEIAALEKQLNTDGAKLTKIRQAAAKRLRPLVEAQLHELGMVEAEFDVSIAPRVDGAGNLIPGASGWDEMEMMVRTNPGQPARPLRKIASGGELSRVMLALKSILVQNDRVSVLVFDEVDANIGGRMGTVIGQKLRQLAGLGGQQVLCITHLPQIAAFADRHIRVAKSITGRGTDKQTMTTVETLNSDRRLDELAEMLAGSSATATTRKQAEELLATAQQHAPLDSPLRESRTAKTDEQPRSAKPSRRTRGLRGAQP